MKKQVDNQDNTASKSMQIILLLISLLDTFCAQKIIRNACGSEAVFYKIASAQVMVDVKSFTLTSNTGVMGCIDACIANSTCHAFNAKKLQANAVICELLTIDRNEKPTGIVAKAGWDYYDTGMYSSKVGQHCSSLSYNPCYPCQCYDSCYSEIGYTCNCTSAMPKRPQIYMAFEKTFTHNDQQFGYDRGADVDGKSVVNLNNGAALGVCSGRSGKVLKLVGTNTGAVAGNFHLHHLNNPNQAKFTISLWVRILASFSGYRSLLSSSKMTSNTGVVLRVDQNGDVMRVLMRVVLADYHSFVHFDVKDTLKTWTHLAITYDDAGPVLIVYINGREMAKTTSKVSHSVSSGGYTNLNFGAGGPYPLVNDAWNICLDDFAYWDYKMTVAEIGFIQTKGSV